MTDNEIIKALACCSKTELGNLCSVCPKFDKDNDFCQEELHESALDLIKRQQEEIEMLDINLKSMRGAANSFKAEVERLKEDVNFNIRLNALSAGQRDERDKLIAELDAQVDYQKKEIERLNKEIQITKDAYTMLQTKNDIIKSEAIKEFAGRLKRKCLIDRGYNILQDGDINNLVKEMTE